MDRNRKGKLETRRKNDKISSKKKAEQLNMPYGTARNRLIKSIMFDFAKKLNMDKCFQCGNSIGSEQELSIEHKVPWLDSDDPTELFFDLENIAFSHIKCNIGAARKPDPKPAKPKSYAGRRIGASGYKGVGLANAKNSKSYKYMVKIRHENKYIHLGCGNDARELALLYDAKALELHGEGAITNKSLGLLD